MDISDKIKKIRLDSNQTQAEFGHSLCVSRDVVNSYEHGKANPPKPFLDLLCVKYDVNPAWLLSDEGSTYRQKDDDEKIAEFIGRVLADDHRPAVKRLIRAIAELDDVGLDVLDKFIDSLTAATKDKQ